MYIDINTIHFLVDKVINLWKGKASEEETKQFKKTLESVVKKQALIQTETLQRIKNLEVKTTYLMWIIGILSIMILALILCNIYSLLQ